MSWERELKSVTESLADLQNKAERLLGMAFDESDVLAEKWREAVAGYGDMWDAMSFLPNSPTTEMIRLGTDVHYVSYGSADGRYPKTCRAAKVVEYDDSTHTLMVFNPTGIHFVQARYDDGNESGTFHLLCDR